MTMEEEYDGSKWDLLTKASNTIRKRKRRTVAIVRPSDMQCPAPTF